MARSMRPAEATDDMVIVVEQNPAQAAGVRSVELPLGPVRLRFTADAVQDPEQVFRPEVAGIVRTVCNGTDGVPETVERPDYRLALRGLTLEGYSVAIGVAEAGGRQIRLRINRTAGNTLGVFRLTEEPETGLALFTPHLLSGPRDQPGSQRLFDEMLSQLYLPLVNLNTYLRHMLDGSTTGRGESLSHSVVQLKMRTETLQFAFDRLIAEVMVDKFATERSGTGPVLDSTAA